MPGKSSADGGEAAAVSFAPAGRSSTLATGLTWPGRGLLLLLNFLPLGQLVALAALGWLGPGTWPVRAALAAGFLWLMPPVVTRVLLAVCPLGAGALAVGGRKFFVWWTTVQLQVIFLRLPWLEEMLRMIPGAYSLWLRLWGARIGRLTFWAHGVEITDRSLLEVGDDVVLGAGVRLAGHVLWRTPEDRMELLVGPVRLGNRCLVGAQSVLGAGAELADDEATHAFFLAPPFSRWRGGRRERNGPTP